MEQLKYYKDLKQVLRDLRDDHYIGTAITLLISLESLAVIMGDQKQFRYDYLRAVREIEFEGI